MVRGRSPVRDDLVCLWNFVWGFSMKREVWNLAQETEEMCFAGGDKGSIMRAGGHGSGASGGAGGLRTVTEVEAITFSDLAHNLSQLESSQH